VEQRLRSIEVQQAEVLMLLKGLAEKMDERIVQSDAWRQKIERTVMGDGNGNKGHSIRVDRLEQSAERQRFLVRTLIGGIAILIMREAWRMVGGV